MSVSEVEGYYINLNHRTDRKEHMEQLKHTHPFFKNIERMEAVVNKRGDIGCSLSHIKCLNELLKRNKECYLIMEDDFCILNEDNFNGFMLGFDKIKNDTNWDIITLTPRGDTIVKNYNQGFHKIINTQTTTGYIIKHNFIKRLLEVYNKGVEQLMENGAPGLYSLDQCWKPLQLESNFIYYENIYGGQLPSYSDIEKIVVDYNKRFIEQYKY
jgi:glycosyl transferase, family 25